MNTTTQNQTPEPATCAGPNCAVSSGSASGGITPGPWTWERHPHRNGVMALTAGKTDVLLATGDHECAWAEIKPADRELIRRAPELLDLLRKADAALKQHGGMLYTGTWLARDIEAAIREPNTKISLAQPET